MTRVDFQWGTGVSLREQVWGWRHDVRAQVVNPDIDGLLTACLLHHLKGWPIVGLYDTQRLFVDAEHKLPFDLQTVAWVDVDMCWPGARSFSQHVVLDRPTDRWHVAAYSETVNPSLLRGHARTYRNRNKYPFGTFQWAWWLAGLRIAPDPLDDLLTGLAWMPDGGFVSVREVWRLNCLQWATAQMPGSILAPLATTDPDRAWRAVRVAEAELKRLSGVREGWTNHQSNLTRGSAQGPVLQFPVDEVPGVLQALCDSITDIYEWQRVLVPEQLVVLRGGYHSTSKPPPGWPFATDRLEVVSLAVTSGSRFCWTSPGDLVAALPA